MTDKICILWADDEIDLLKPHVMFLTAKGYHVITTNSGGEALELVKSNDVDIIFLDEQMPGLSGIETLIQMKNIVPNIPVVMITKSEEESIMEDAIGSKISDYLIKPVNPNQIILCLKKNLETKRLQSEKASLSYQQEFRKISMEVSGRLNFEEWIDVYKKLVYWELELGKSQDPGIIEILKMQKNEANQQFCKYIERNYTDWLKPQTNEKPIQSHTILKEKVFPLLKDNKPTFLLVVDNLRYDQWKTLQPKIEEYLRVDNDEIYYSILPSVTQYARNSLFAGLLPSEIEKKYPQLWLNEDEEGTKNQFEPDLMNEYLRRFGYDIKTSYHKVLNMNFGKKLVDNLPNLMSNKLNVIVYNFVDMLSHARTEMDIIRELADDESAYRSLTLSWFEHSPLFDIIKFLGSKNVNVVITTDHGSIKVNNPVKVKGDKTTNTNLRFKIGKMLDYNPKDVFEIKNPQDAYLPKLNVSSSYIFTRSNDFFAYPNNYNYYVSYYLNTFQHGGISMEELLIPIITLKNK
ncbi:MAG: PglZ domain-containing protein [Bacteroidales bacterium]